MTPETTNQAEALDALPVTPAQALRAASDVRRLEAAPFVAEVNAQLKDGYKEGLGLVVDINAWPGGVTQTVIDIFNASGWEVGGKSDHQGRFLTFTAKRTLVELPEPATRYRHVKTGREYSFTAIGKWEPNLEPVVIYEAPDGTVWVRPAVEFFDGRFEAIDTECEAG